MVMMQTQVIIVGAGPAGLGLGLALAKFNIHSVILEKETEITTDPRGVYLTGDAVRILYDLGIGEDLAHVGHDAESVQIHRSSYGEPPFLTLRAGATNALQQAVPEGLLQMQPRLERALHRKIQASSYCRLFTGCTVTARTSEEPPRVQFRDQSNETHDIEGQWLVGADGKAGVVRKRFLEPTAGIKQEPGVYHYDGTSIAANLHLSLPTPASHPDFPLWRLGYTPQQVYNLYWPKGWHFCCPPGKPTAGGRFGPHEERLWRHEFRHDTAVHDDDEAEALFWEHITPMLSLRGDRHQDITFDAPVPYPRDCIKILRCRPYHCTHRVVNKWFDKRTVLVGDAAHVFPPFAGQGIASGLRDSHQLAWRLALLVDRFPADKPMPSWAQMMLEAWALERRRSVDTTAYLSISLGRMSSEPPKAPARLSYKMKARIDRSASMANAIDPLVRIERTGVTDVKDGFYLKKYHGGARLAQIYVTPSPGGQSILSDRLLLGSPSAMTLLVIADAAERSEQVAQARLLLSAACLPASVMTLDSIVAYTPHAQESTANVSERQTNEPFAVYQPRLLDATAPEYKRCGGYDEKAYVERLGKKSRFVIVRGDFFVFACAKNDKELARCLEILATKVRDGPI